MKTIVEVGANLGTDTELFLNKEENIVYAFEPTPELVVELQRKFKGNDRFNLVPMAADVENGFKWFNVAGCNNWGCSSLYDFSDGVQPENLGEASPAWPHHTGLFYTDKVKVMTIRLDTFMENNNIEVIDYLWIDAQGNDLKVLQSLGSRIKDVVAGNCEGALNFELYKDTGNTCQQIEEWLFKHGFKIVNVVPDDQQKEANIFFERADV
jgi:FkbM family methyltransferase